jgi:AcrR family transcriptional regulator
MFLTMARKSGKNDEARERSRAALLRAGADLMIEDALQQPFAALRLRRLCERAGLSTGAFYVHWARLEDYHADLARHLTEEDELGFADEFDAMTRAAAMSSGDSPLQALSRVADLDLHLLVSNQMWDAMELVNLTWGRTYFQDQLARGYQLIDRMTGELYGSILAQAGRSPRPPWTWETIGTVLQALAEGVGLRHKIDPGAVAGTSESVPGLYATAVAAVLTMLTRPAGDEASSAEAIGALLGSASSVAHDGPDTELAGS